MEAIIPTEIVIPIVRAEIPKKANVEAIANNQDTIEKLREMAVVLIASYQQRLANFHNQHVKLRTFLPGELVLRMVFENMANPVDGKF